jgi:hypothetical protein
MSDRTYRRLSKWPPSSAWRSWALPLVRRNKAAAEPLREKVVCPTVSALPETL